MMDNNDDACCVVGGCKYNPKGGQQVPDLNDTIKFYSFPQRSSKPGDMFQRVKWVEFVRISLGLDPKSMTSWTPSSGDKICSTHFLRNCKSENPSKSNYAPTIYPECLHGLPPEITYDLRDLVCWWIKEGEQNLSTLFPIVEAEKLDKPVGKPKPNEKREHQERELKSFTLVEVDVTSGPHPSIKAYIRVEKDLSFRACMKNTPVPAHALLGDSESVCVLGSVNEFQYALTRLVKLNPCNGTSTSGLKGYPKNMNGKIANMLLNGRETERLVSNECEVVAAIKVCDACKKLWNKAFEYKRYARPEKSSVVENEQIEEVPINVEERLGKCERIIENYKAEVCRLLGKNKELKDKILVFKEALRQEVEQNMEARELGGGRKRKISFVDSDVEEAEEFVEEGADQKRRRDLNDTDNCDAHIVVESNARVSSIRVGAVSGPKILAGGSDDVKRKTAVDFSGQRGDVTSTSICQLNKEAPATAGKSGIQSLRQNPVISTSEPKSTLQQKPIPTTSQQKAPQKVLKITREQAVLLRKLTSTSSSGNVIRVQASQLASINKILGRPNVPNTPPVQPSTTSNPAAVSTHGQEIPPQVQKPVTPTPPPKQQVIRILESRQTIEDKDKSNSSGTSKEGVQKVYNVTVVQK